MRSCIACIVQVVEISLVNLLLKKIQIRDFFFNSVDEFNLISIFDIIKPAEKGMNFCVVLLGLCFDSFVGVF